MSSKDPHLKLVNCQMSSKAGNADHKVVNTKHYDFVLSCTDTSIKAIKEIPLPKINVGVHFLYQSKFTKL